MRSSQEIVQAGRQAFPAPDFSSKGAMAAAVAEGIIHKHDNILSAQVESVELLSMGTFNILCWAAAIVFCAASRSKI